MSDLRFSVEPPDVIVKNFELKNSKKHKEHEVLYKSFKM